MIWFETELEDLTTRLYLKELQLRWLVRPRYDQMSQQAALDDAMKVCSAGRPVHLTWPRPVSLLLQLFDLLQQTRRDS